MAITTKIDNRPQAVFLCNADRLFQVYNEATLEKLDEDFSLFREVITSQTLTQHEDVLRETEYVFSTWGMPSLTEEQIARYLPKLKAVFYGAGSVQDFSRPYFARGIRVFSSWGANAIPVAEYSAAQILLASKGYFQCIDRCRKVSREAGNAFFHAQPGNYDVRIGILGAGMIGRLVMKQLRDHDVELLVYDPYVTDQVLDEYGAKRADLLTVFKECQVISCHIANRPATVGMLRYEHFSAMKKNATFINTGRGQQVVEEDLIRAFAEEPDRTALLDVTFPEPPVPESPLYTLQNVFLTPHIAGSEGNEVARMGAYMQQEAARLLHGNACFYEVFLPMLETMA